MKKILNIFKEKQKGESPLWLMRQAGRYLPEYRALREKKKSFLDLVYDPESASEVTVQPLRRFDFDAAILFSDILVVPHALGLDLKFEDGEGPCLQVVETIDGIKRLRPDRAKERYRAVYQTVVHVRQKMGTENFKDRALFGFAGGPWTIACYMMCGSGRDRGFTRAIDRARADPVFVDTLIDLIVHTTIEYLEGQIQAGAEVIQIFDSWAQCAQGDLFDRYVIAPTQRIVAGLKRAYPTVPMIGFPRQVGARCADYVLQTQVDGVQLDSDVDIQKLRADMGPKIVTQGFLDPEILRTGGDMLDRAIDRILSATSDMPHIFNLSHGILPDTPIAHVERLVERVRKESETRREVRRVAP